MKKQMTRTFLAALLLAILIAAPALAQAPSRIHIEVLETFAPNEPFTASGPAVESGEVCPDGLVDDVIVVVLGDQRGFRLLHVLKRFTCGDGSGSFDIKLAVRLNLATNEAAATWKVVGGTGNYVDLAGSGKLVGIPQVGGQSILDIYDGVIE